MKNKYIYHVRPDTTTISAGIKDACFTSGAKAAAYIRRTASWWLKPRKGVRACEYYGLLRVTVYKNGKIQFNRFPSDPFKEKYFPKELAQYRDLSKSK